MNRHRVLGDESPTIFQLTTELPGLPAYAEDRRAALRSDFSTGEMGYSRNPFLTVLRWAAPKTRQFQHPPVIEALFDANAHPDERIRLS
jgi:hypothetical protein